MHMIEELPSPSRAAPCILWLSVLIGAITDFIVMLVCLFCIQDLESITFLSRSALVIDFASLTHVSDGQLSLIICIAVVGDILKLRNLDCVLGLGSAVLVLVR